MTRTKTANQLEDDECDDEPGGLIAVIKRIQQCATWIELAELLLQFEPTPWEAKFLNDLIAREQKFVSFKQKVLLARMVGEPLIEHLPRRPREGDQDAGKVEDDGGSD